MTPPSKCDAKKTQLLPVLWLENSWTARISIHAKNGGARSWKAQSNPSAGSQPTPGNHKFR